MVAARTGISLNEFDQLTPVQVYDLVNEHRDMHQVRYREHAELHRMFTMFLLNVHMKKIDQMTDPRRLVTFSWEDSIDEELLADLEATDWDAMDKKYGNLVPYKRPKTQNLN